MDCQDTIVNQVEASLIILNGQGIRIHYLASKESKKIDVANVSNGTVGIVTVMKGRVPKEDILGRIVKDKTKVI